MMSESASVQVESRSFGGLRLSTELKSTKNGWWSYGYTAYAKQEADRYSVIEEALQLSM